MGSRIQSIVLTLAALGAAAAATACPARADEAFLCGPDTVVYVKAADIEERKRTDPCIARYFGLSVETPAPAAVAPSAKVPPLRKPAATAPLGLKGPEAPELSERVSPARERMAAAAPPVASPGTDYRNVRVLNAETPQGQWFRHLR